MLQLEKVDTLVEEFVDKKVIKGLNKFVESDEISEYTKAAGVFSTAFSVVGISFSVENKEADKKLIVSFKNNLTLLIQKTWVEKSDIELKEQVLYQLEQFCAESDCDWKKSYVPFLDMLDNAVYLMFGQQTKTDDFCEYALRIDPEFGIFWWYIRNLPRDADWPIEKCRCALLLGMYFLANY